MKIIVADDHALLREGLRQIVVQLEPSCTILEAADYTGALNLVTQHPDASLAVIDLNMPLMERQGGIKGLISAALSVPVVVLSASEDCDDMRHVLDAGAMGYIPKSENAAVILSALRLVLSGGIYVPPALVNAGATAQAGGRRVTDELTPRQREVLKCVVTGMSNKEVGRQLGLSEATVKAHVAAIFKALNVSNRAQAVAAARRLGWWSD